MTARPLLAPALAAALVVAGAPAAAQAKTVTVRTTGKAVVLKAGDRLVVDVAENPSTGYAWKTLARPAFLRQLSSTYKATPTDGPLVGGGGRRTFTYRAARAGTGTLKLVYRRSFDPDPADTRFTVRVTVRA